MNWSAKRVGNMAGWSMPGAIPPSTGASITRGDAGVGVGAEAGKNWRHGRDLPGPPAYAVGVGAFDPPPLLHVLLEGLVGAVVETFIA